MQVEIPGGTAEIRERPTMGGRIMLQAESARLFAAVEVEYPSEGPARFDPKTMLDNPVIMETFLHLNIAGIVALLTSWTLDRPLPKSKQEILAWEGDDLELGTALQTAVAPFVLEATMGPKLTAGMAIDPETGQLDRSSPTSPSSDSKPGGLAATIPTTNRTPTSSNGSGRSPTAASSRRSRPKHS